MKSKQLNKSTAEKILSDLEDVKEELRPKSLLEIFEDMIEDTWMDKTYYYFYRKFKYSWWNPSTMRYNVIYGIGNLWSYFHLIWNDRDWDYHFWLKMNLKKLQRMENLIRTHGSHLYNIQDADNIHLAVLGLQRIIADDYHDNAFRNHDKKWGEVNFSWKKCDDRSGCSEMLTNRKNVKTDSDENYEHKASKLLYRHSDYMKKQDLAYVTGIINKYLFGWWD